MAEGSLRRTAIVLACIVAVIAAAVFVLRPTFPNYDSYYQLVWGQELADGQLPDRDVFRTPTPHPLSELVAVGLAHFGLAADRLLVLLTLGAWLGLLAAVFRFTQILLGTLVASAAVVVMLTRTDLAFFALRGVVDVWFLALVFAAVVWELSRRRAGWPVMILLVLAGLLRPEGWVFAGLYALWLLPALGLRRALPFFFAAIAAPLIWMGWDWAVSGDPLYSLTKTREVAGEFKRDRGPIEAIKLIPDYIGANEKIVNVAAGGLGAVSALWLLRARAALPLALMAIGVAVFLAIAAAGLSVIPRYLAIPSILFNLGVAFAFTAWLVVEQPRARRPAQVLAVIALALVAWRTPSYFKDFQKLNGQTNFVKNQHRDLEAVLDDHRVVPLLESCRPITTPTHSAIPVIRFLTGLPKDALEASIAQDRPPSRGVLLIGETFNFEPTAARSTSGVRERSARKWWSNYPLSTFTRVAGNERWQVYENCDNVEGGAGTVQSFPAGTPGPLSPDG